MEVQLSHGKFVLFIFVMDRMENVDFSKDIALKTFEYMIL